MYSNNNNSLFVNKIIGFIHYKLKNELFDYIITLHHPNRRTKHKEYNDLILCIQNIEIDSLFFIDDRKHKGMKHPKVDYVKCEKFVYQYEINEIMNILCKYNGLTIHREYIYQELKKYKLSTRILPIEVYNISTREISKKIEIFIHNISFVN